MDDIVWTTCDELIFKDDNRNEKKKKKKKKNVECFYVV